MVLAIDVYKVHFEILFAFCYYIFFCNAILNVLLLIYCLNSLYSLIFWSESYTFLCLLHISNTNIDGIILRKLELTDYLNQKKTKIVYLAKINLCEYILTYIENNDNYDI